MVTLIEHLMEEKKKLLSTIKTNKWRRIIDKKLDIETLDYVLRRDTNAMELIKNWVNSGYLPTKKPKLVKRSPTKSWDCDNVKLKQAKYTDCIARRKITRSYHKKTKRYSRHKVTTDSNKDGYVVKTNPNVGSKQYEIIIDKDRHKAYINGHEYNISTPELITTDHVGNYCLVLNGYKRVLDPESVDTLDNN
jgi:hypothetical protein